MDWWWVGWVRGQVASRYSAAEQEVEDLQDEILAGMASDPNFLPEAAWWSCFLWSSRHTRCWTT